MTTPSWAPNPPITSDAVAREAAWLATATDSLPALLTSAGGPFDVVQAYWPGARFASQKTSVYVQRARITDPKVAAQRIRPQYPFQLKVVWPVRVTTAGIAETEAQNFDYALELLRQRIEDVVGDKTHGGRFLSVAQVPESQPVTFDLDDPETTIQQQKALRCRVTYFADDFEFNG